MPQDFISPDFPFVSSSGIWEELRVPKLSAVTEPRPALFLDRDGVVVEEVNYLHRAENLTLIAGAAEVIAKANALKVPVVIVTNQAGIAYGYFGWQEFEAVQNKLHRELAASGATIDAVYACPFHLKGETIWSRAEDHEARKPNAGMLTRAQKQLNLDLRNSWIVGDRDTDILAGKKAGLAGGLHVLTGHGNRPGERTAALQANTPAYQVTTGKDLRAALELPLLK
ncbi:HAD family hydrolase [Kiloniella laminariae]|uniref:D,D-heptose 1,7-bisphosphate phosphatase n=1 Tax=Kiloniella laminariae TaxID=454162 RepID=A0ABT4LDK8_9PROT|nr:HAD family hydrolase [Kiloniella laminariae]MCZ4279182.1 HAD family hydrolase [Kiloniella laminariae]